MSGWAFLAQMLNSRDQDRRQEEEFKQRRALMSQASTDRASERAFDIDAATKGSLAEYKGKKDIDSQYADQEATNAAKRAVAAHYASLGIPAEMLKQGDEIFEAARQRYLAESKASTQKAKTEGLGAEIKGEGMAKTRESDLSRLFSESQEGALRADKSKKFVEENPKAVEAGMMGRELAPAAAIARNNTMSVGPGEFLKRLTSGSPMIDSFFGPLEGQGATTTERDQMINFGGQMVPSGQKLKETTQGFIKPIFSGKLSALTGENAPAPTMPQSERIGLQVTPPRTMPGRSSGGKSMFRTDLPMEMQNAQPTEEDEKAEWVRKMLQKLYTEPKF